MRYLNDRVIRRTILAALAIFILFEVTITISERFRIEQEQQTLLRQSYALETEIMKVFSSVYVVSDAYISFLELDSNVLIEDNEEFLNHLMSSEDIFIRNIAYIEDTTIKFNYPYEQNITSIGVDLATIDGQSEAVLHVKENEESMMIGPVELIQGGQAFILRQPVLVDDQYIGQIATVIDADELNNLILEIVESYGVTLKVIEHHGDELITIGEEFGDNYISISVDDDYIHWSLQVYNPSNDLSSALMRHVIRFIGVLVALSVSTFIYKNGRLQEEVHYKANHDSLTNDFNRTRFVEDFNNQLFTGNLIAFTDINKFKILNDTLGHQFGDWALKKLSIKFNHSGKFITYRNSGDEFIIVSKEPMKENEFLQHVQGFHSYIYNEQLEQNILITLSIGVIETLDKNLSLETMLMYLDYAMYDAKKAGKTYTLVNNELMVQYADQKIIEDTIIHDINDNNLHTYFQPIINLETKEVEGLEALSRWKRDGQIVPAAKFINIVKKIKYVEQLDQNLFDNIQKEYTKLKEQEIDVSKLYFAINLSAETLKIFENNFKEFDAFVKNRVIPVNQIVFEISEDVNLGIISIDTLNYIRKQGYGLTIDDFGSGVSKLADVLSGEIQAIKMDKSMLPNTIKDDHKLAAFNTIIKAINASGSKICVEGVETKEQLKISMNAKVSSVQGYLFAKPISFEETVAFIKEFSFTNYMN